MKLFKVGLMAAVVAGLLIASAGVASAQDTKEGRKKGGFSPAARVEQMDKIVKLTDAQKTKLTALFEEQGKKMAEFRDLPQDQRREKMQGFRQENDKKLKEILTPDQFEKWQKERPQFGKKGEGKKKE